MSTAQRTEGIWVLPQAMIIIEGYVHDPADLDAMLGVTDSWSGQRDRAGVPVAAWAYALPDHARDTVDTQMESALAMLEPSAEHIATLINEGAAVELRITGYVGTRSVARLSPDQVRRIAALGVVLAFETVVQDR